MVLSDSMFLFEITIKDLKTYKRCKELILTAEFADVFKICFKNPILNSAFKKVRQMKQREKYKVRMSNIRSKNRILDAKSLNIHSILAAKTPSFLISLMKQHPLEISVFSKTNPTYMLGSSLIPWSKCFSNYVRNVHKNKGNALVHEQGTYNIYGEMNMKRIAAVDMCIKLLYLGEELSNQLTSRSSHNPNTFKQIQIDSKPLFVKSTGKYSENEKLGANCIFSSNNHEILKKSVNKDRSNKGIAKEFLTKPFNSKSDGNLASAKHKIITKSLSFNSISQCNRNNILRYIFGDLEGSYGDKNYHVCYFTVEKGNTDTDSPKVSEVESIHQSSASRKKIIFKRCDSECHGKKPSESAYSLDLSEGAAQISVTKCTEVDCDDREHRKVPSPPDDRILLDISNITKNCCLNEQITEKVIGGITTKMHIGEDPCFCTCECTFGFIKKTTYCNICGGYEVAGEELSRKPATEMPIPCPFFHKLVDKSKLKTWSNSGSESKKKGEDSKYIKIGSAQKAASNKHLTVSEKKSVESEKDSKAVKKKKMDDRFKFNYGYKGIPPQIGHSKCVLSCSGPLDNVPKNMGWLWTAEKIPGMKFRPLWKPGATNKHVVRLLKIARNPGEAMSKKKRKDTGKKKRSLKRPLLVVHKKDGEYTVTMETMKNYSKPRALNQHPYEDKPVVTYTIGRTEEENRERLKKKERARRRLERAQRHFIQDTFRDMCNEICMKAYQQALGILPETEDPACLCYPALPTSKTTNMNVSCSCSEDNLSLGSDTDSDEWIVEFTPPNAYFDPTYKGKKIFKVDNGTQYTYLDYRVKLADRFGNPVPRFFKGPDGKQKCSDLGGFWSPDNKWLEINIDGYIAPDGRWAPNVFIGPSGEHVEAEAGKFQATNGKWLIIGVDGYIDSQNRWKFYPKKTGTVIRRQPKDSKKREIVDKKYEKSDASWSCFGDVSPKRLSKLGIVGHGGDRKLLMSTLEDMLARGEDVKIPQPKTIFHLPTKKTKLGQKNTYLRTSSSFESKNKCHHRVPSSKGIVAVDGQGRKTYFRLKNATNKRPNERLTSLASQGISLSSFHVPCFSSFINSEILKQQNRERLLAVSDRNISMQT